MGFMEAFVSELDKLAGMPGAPVIPSVVAKVPGAMAKAKSWIKSNPGKSGIALGWFLRGILGGSDKE